jgi:ferredoxin
LTLTEQVEVAQKVACAVDLPVIAGADDISVQEYADLGYQIMIYATTPAVVAANALAETYQHLKDTGRLNIDLRVWVDHNVCVGNAMCETIAPKVFRLNANRQSEAVDPEGDTVEKILDAAENCPVSAIIVEDAETEEHLFP